MIASHLHTYLNEKNIPFECVPKLGVSINRKYYDVNIFEKFNITNIDSTFMIYYTKTKEEVLNEAKIFVKNWFVNCSESFIISKVTERYGNLLTIDEIKQLTK